MQAIPKVKKVTLGGLYFFIYKEGIHVKIVKVLNNNVVLSVDENNEDVIVLGNGIAFAKKHGDPIDDRKIERVFTQQVPELTARFQKMLRDIPMEYLETTEKIILNAKLKLNHDFNDNLYISLIDHINFTIQRYREEMLIENRLLLETKLLYKDEFAAGMDAIRMINETFDVNLPEDEAAFIALHFVNASSGGTMQDTLQQTRIVQDSLTIIKNFLKINFREDSIAYYRLVTHLKFFAQRITAKKIQVKSGGDIQLLEIVKLKYQDAYECADRIAKFIQIEFGYAVSEEERLYLTIHIERIRESND